MAVMLLVACASVAGGQTTDGQAVYVQAGCEACHGAGGGGTAAAPALAGTTRALPDFVAYVRTPAGVMPAHGVDLVSDDALARVQAFLRSSRVDAAAGAGARAGRVEVGAELFRKTGCFQCHADEGQGGAQGPRLGPTPMLFTRFLAYVRNPPGQMPPYTAQVMSDQDLADVHAFLAARPRPPAVSQIPLLAP
jgi:mono/diheme cytochrome c family protein